MFSLGHHQRYLLYGGVCDMRKGFDGLCGLIRGELGRDPVDGCVYIFLNRHLTQVKLLCWEPGGLVLYQKRLESGRFSLPKAAKDSGVLYWPDLVLMVEGIEVNQVKKKKRFDLEKR